MLIFNVSDLTGGAEGIERGRVARGGHKKARTGRADVQNQELVIIVCVEISVVEGVAIAVDAVLDHHVAHSLGGAMPSVPIGGPAIGDSCVTQVSAGLAPGIPGV